MIAKKINMLPGLSKGNDKRLSLAKKQNTQNILIKKKSIPTNNEDTQNKKNTQPNKFSMDRKGIFSVTSKRVPFNLIFQTNEKIKTKNNQLRKRSLSSLLRFGCQRNQASRQVISEKNYQQLDFESISSKAIDFGNVSQEKQKYVSENEREFTSNQFQLIKNQYKKDEIKQSLSQFEQRSIDQIQNLHVQQNIKKNCQISCKYWSFY